ncbi:unnamed protein product, partial [Scytosiphon promiscuus]
TIDFLFNAHILSLRSPPTATARRFPPMPSSRLSLIVVAAGLAGLAYAAPAMADPAQTVSAEIQYDNSALHSRAGAGAV